jgi:hypothetical protein
MKHVLIISLFIIPFFSCRTSPKASFSTSNSAKIKQVLLDDNTFKIEVYSQDKKYGYTKSNPIKVGGGSEGPKNERRFLNALAGPNGERIHYVRLGSCCPFKTKNSEWGGMLDMYEVTIEGSEEKVILYINMYDSDVLMVPVGFTLRY